MLSALDRKLVRDVAHLRGQLAAVALVVACGIAVLVMMRNNYASLLASRDAYYARHDFADVFASLVRAPRGLVARIAVIPGVARVDARVSAEITLDVPGLEEPATGRLLSLPRGRDALNRVHVRRGRLPEPGARGRTKERYDNVCKRRNRHRRGTGRTGLDQRVGVVHLVLFGVPLHHQQLGAVDLLGRRPQAGWRHGDEQVADGRVVAHLADELPHDAQAARSGDGTVMRIDVAGDDAGQGRLARPVRPDEGDLGALPHPHGDVEEEGPAIRQAEAD